MKRLALACLATASLLLASCAPMFAAATGLPATPAAAANRIVLDEQVASSVEVAYTAFRTALEVATDAGLIRGERATQMAALDNRAYRLVVATRAAYRAGNASGYLAAAREARTAIEQALGAIRGNP